MTACGYCRQRKGKRVCPALGGAICSLCCGQHRLKEIDCPADCVWLGGLAVVRDPARAAAEFTKDDYASAFDKLLAYAHDHVSFRNEALSLLFDEPEPEEWELGVATGYICYGYRGADGQRLVDRFLVARGRELRSAEAAALVALQRAWASLFEVESVQTGAGLGLRDLLSGETVRVREVSATSHLKKWDVLFAWVMAFPDHLELTGAACLVPRPHVEHVRKALDAELKPHRRERKGAADRELVGELAWAPIRALREAVRDFRMPELRTTHGEELLLCKAHYATKDEAAVRERLSPVAELEPDDGEYAWLDLQSHLSLGHVSVARDELVLETLSRERLERGKRLLEAALGDLATHRGDSIQAPESAIREHPDHPPQREITEDVERAVVGQYLQEHYRRWLDDPLPALNGKTPRKAVRSRAGRAQVAALLKDIENGTLGMPGEEAVDFTAMRRELGLLVGEDGRVRYDAEEPPDAALWLEADEQKKGLAVEEHHRALGAHADMPNLRLHALLHVIVENQVAGGDPPEAQQTIARLVAAGVTRHAAIHAVGSVVAGEMWRLMRERTVFDRAAAARALARLRPEDWRS